MIDWVKHVIETSSRLDICLLGLYALGILGFILYYPVRLLGKCIGFDQRVFITEVHQLAGEGYAKFNEYVMELCRYWDEGTADLEAVERAHRAAQYSLEVARKKVTLLSTPSGKLCVRYQLAVAAELRTLTGYFSEFFDGMEDYMSQNPQPNEAQRELVKQQFSGALRELQPLAEETQLIIKRLGAKYGIARIPYYRLKTPTDQQDRLAAKEA